MTAPHYHALANIGPFKPIPVHLKESIEGEIKALLHAHRDTLRNLRKYDTRYVTFVASDGYYGEAFGIMRMLHILEYGYFGSNNIDGLRDNVGATQKEHNLKWWFSELENQVLEEEGYHSKTYICEYCFSKYRQDTARMRYSPHIKSIDPQDIIAARLDAIQDESESLRIGKESDYEVRIDLAAGESSETFIATSKRDFIDIPLDEVKRMLDDSYNGFNSTSD